MAPQLGGRARNVSWGNLQLDNGQHILTGACTSTLALMTQVGIQPASVLRRTPLLFTTPQRRMAPWMANGTHWQRALGLLSHAEMSWTERWAWLKCILSMQWSRPESWQGKTASDWLSQHAPGAVRPWLEALCVSAMNLPADQADAIVFLTLMQASFESPQASDLLLPRVGLSDLLPHQAAQWLLANGAQIKLGHHVKDLKPLLETGAVILACSALEAARLTCVASPSWSQQARHIEYGAIATVYTRWPGSAPELLDPLVIMPVGSDSPAQVVMDLGLLRGDATHQGLWSWVISHAQCSREEAAQQVLTQAQAIWGMQPDLVACFLDPRATLLCRPQTQRPGHEVAPNIWACGDYIRSELPSTLEGAVRSGARVIQAIQSH